MDEGLRQNWNNIVKPRGDVVYILGDLSFCGDPEKAIKWLNSLNGTKHLVLGNHDKLVTKNQKIFEEKCFETISSYKEITVNGQMICLFHYAPRVWNRSHFNSWCLWGHTHGALEPYGRSVDVGIDSPWITGKIEHRPFAFEEIKEFMKDRNNPNLIKGD